MGPIDLNQKLRDRNRSYLSYIWQVKFLLLSLIALLYSGRAYGFEYSSLLGFGLLFCLVEAVFCFVMAIRNFKKQPPIKNYALHVLLFNLLAIAVFYFSSMQDNKLVAETIKRGDQIIGQIELYKANNGRYPAGLTDVPDALLIKPALENTEFQYSVLNNGGYRLGFNSISWQYCSHENNSTQWHCAD